MGEDYLLPLILSKSNKNLRKVLPYLKEQGVIETIKDSASILTLSLEQIQERERFIEEIGEDVVKNGKFNSIFGLSKARYQKRAKGKDKKEGKEIAIATKDVTLEESEQAQEYLNIIIEKDKTNSKETP